jgi:hypothetical protein
MNDVRVKLLGSLLALVAGAASVVVVILLARDALG